MTPQEQQMIDGLIDRVCTTKLANKDQDADRHLHDGLGSNPDALYILAQTVLGQTYSLGEAARQVQALRAENEQLKSQGNNKPAAPPALPSNQTQGSGWQGQGSSAGNGGWSAAPTVSGQGYGTSVPYQPVNNPQPQYGQGYPVQPQYGQGYPVQQPQYGQPYPQQGYTPGYGQPQYGYPAPPMGGGSFGGGGFLQGAMTAAAGVVAGEVLFHGVEDIARGFERPREYGGERFDGGSRETVVNNYYEDGGRHDGGSNLGDVSYSGQNDASRESAGGSDFGSAAGGAFGSSGAASDDSGWSGSGEHLLTPDENFNQNGGGNDAGWSGSPGSGQSFDGGGQQGFLASDSGSDDTNGWTSSDDSSTWSGDSDSGGSDSGDTDSGDATSSDDDS